MARQMEETPTDNMILGLDLGTNKICALVAEAMPDGTLNVIGVGTAPSTGLRKGVVVNIEATVESVRKALAEAERMAGMRPSTAFVSVGGEHIRGMSSHGVIAVARKDHEIVPEDVERVLEAAKAVAIPQDREIIHVLTQEYLIDNQDGIRDPVGMSGVRLEAVVHVVTGAVTSVQNVMKSCERAGVGIEDIVLQPLASAEAVLADDEKELGVALLDIGAGTTDLIIFLEGAVRHTAVFQVGGNQVTRDLAIGLTTSNDEAEQLKRKYGNARVESIPEAEEIMVAGVGGRPPQAVPRRRMGSIIQPRMEELFALVDAELERSGFKGKLAAGMVLTGGAALLEGSTALAEDVLRLPVRLGRPVGLSGLADVVQSPEYATAVGLARHGVRARQVGKGRMHTSTPTGPAGPGIMSTLKRFFNDYI